MRIKKTSLKTLQIKKPTIRHVVKTKKSKDDNKDDKKEEENCDIQYVRRTIQVSNSDILYKVKICIDYILSTKHPSFCPRIWD